MPSFYLLWVGLALLIIGLAIEGSGDFWTDVILRLLFIAPAVCLISRYHDGVQSYIEESKKGN